jgi:DNA polymerase-3 subunit alpha
MLNWERELVGMYISEHPLTPYLNELRATVTHSSATLGEAAHQEKVCLAGMVSSIRPYQTKTGKMMAWVNLEDLHGNVELVLFPRVWEKFQFALEVGGLILVEGKADTQSTPAKVLVDDIRTEIKLTVPLQLPLRVAPEEAAATQRLTENPAVYEVTPADHAVWDTPPPPENPPDWETDYLPASPSLQRAETTVPEKITAKTPMPEATASPRAQAHRLVTACAAGSRAARRRRARASGSDHRLASQRRSEARSAPHQPAARHIHLLPRPGSLPFPYF